MYETYNFLIKYIEKEIDIKNLIENYKKILIIFSPVIPHLANECLEDLNVNKGINWPEIENIYLETENVDYIVQINGKKRALINAKKNISQEILLNDVQSNTMTKKYLENKLIKKVIFVKNRLINFVIDE